MSVAEGLSQRWNDIFQRDRRKKQAANARIADLQEDARDFLKWYDDPATRKELLDWLEQEAFKALELDAERLSEQAIRTNTFREIFEKLSTKARKARRHMEVSA